MSQIELLWNSPAAHAWHQGLASLALLLMVMGALLARYRPINRRSVALTLATFIGSLAGQFAGGVLAQSGLAGPGAWLHEAALILDILNDAWSDNWGFVPLTDAEADAAPLDLEPAGLEERRARHRGRSRCWTRVRT